MGTIESLTITANQIDKLLELAVQPLNDKLEEAGHKIIFRATYRGGKREVIPFLKYDGIWRSEINLKDEDMPKLLTMNPEDIIKHLKS